MVTGITRRELCDENGVTLFGKYRARLFGGSQVPVVKYMSWMMEKEIMVIDRFVEPGSEGSLDGNYESENMGQVFKYHEQGSKDHSSLNSSALGGSPLKFEFLTLSKLQEKEPSKLTIKAYDYSVVEEFVCSPLKAAEARSLAGKLMATSVPFDEQAILNVVIWIICDTTDFFHTSSLGFCKLSNGIATYHVRAFPLKHVGVNKFLENYMKRAFGTHKSYADIAHCVYDVIPRTGNTDQDSTSRISGYMELQASWRFSNCDRYFDGLLAKPPPSASVSVKISPGWLDLRMPLLELADELKLVLALGRALRTGEMIWPNIASDKVLDDEKFMKSALRSLFGRASTFSKSETLKTGDGLDIPRDFTEELWLILHHCRSNQGLTDAIRFVFDALKSGYKNTMVLANNKSTMARLLRDACSNELLLPRLEGLTPIQIFMEMGLERLRRACMDEFLNRGYFETVAEINAMFDCYTLKDPQDQADALFRFYNSLLVMNTCKQFFRLDRHHMNIIARQVLGQYNKLDISPTTEDITEKMLEKMGIVLHSRLSFADVLNPVHKYRIPKIWKLEVTIEKANRQGWVTRHMVLCSRTTQFLFIKNKVVSDMASEKKSFLEGDSAEQLSCLKEESTSNVNDEEIMELDAALRHYYVTVVTNNFHVPFIKCLRF